MVSPECDSPRVSGIPRVIGIPRMSSSPKLTGIPRVSGSTRVSDSSRVSGCLKPKRLEAATRTQSYHRLQSKMLFTELKPKLNHQIPSFAVQASSFSLCIWENSLLRADGPASTGFRDFDFFCDYVFFRFSSKKLLSYGLSVLGPLTKLLSIGRRSF